VQIAFPPNSVEPIRFEHGYQWVINEAYTYVRLYYTWNMSPISTHGTASVA